MCPEAKRNKGLQTTGSSNYIYWASHERNMHVLEDVSFYCAATVIEANEILYDLFTVNTNGTPKQWNINHRIGTK
jgi:hypothetical protein